MLSLFACSLVAFALKAAYTTDPNLVPDQQLVRSKGGDRAKELEEEPGHVAELILSREDDGREEHEEELPGSFLEAAKERIAHEGDQDGFGAYDADRTGDIGSIEEHFDEGREGLRDIHDCGPRMMGGRSGEELIPLLPRVPLLPAADRPHGWMVVEALLAEPGQVDTCVRQAFPHSHGGRTGLIAAASNCSPRELTPPQKMTRAAQRSWLRLKMGIKR